MKLLIDRIASIKSRAQALNLTVGEVCRSAGVNRSTFWKWDQGDGNPKMKGFEVAMERLEAVLTAEEKRIHREVPKHDEVAA